MVKRAGADKNIGTKIIFIGGVNEDRIGGNATVIEHTNEKNETKRVLVDLGAMFAPYESGFEAAYPNMEEYFDRVNPATGEETKAQKPIDSIFITHAHEDHIGALVNYVRMGYKLPPIRTSRFTKNVINIVFNQERIKVPEMITVNPGDNIRIGDDMVVEPFGDSHSTIEPLGFHVLTFMNDKPHAGIVTYGDLLTVEDMPVGKFGYSQEAMNDLLKRKLTTTFLIDSTSITPQTKERLSFEELVNNCCEVIKNNPDRKTILSPVISRSFQNVAIDIEVARRLGTKVCLEGAWVKLIYKAMQFSGYKNFDDVIYKGSLKNYLADDKVKLKYVVSTGAFAQGLKEYQENQSDDFYNIPMAAATKIALGLHKDMGINPRTLILARQRIIDEINGESGPAMLQMMAAKGAKVVMSPSGRKIANFEEVVMQNSGHLNRQEFSKLIKENKKYAPNAVYISIHGNPEQCAFTAQVAQNEGMKTLQVLNSECIKVSEGQAEKLPQGKEPFRWIAVKRILPNPTQENSSIPPEGKLEFWKVDKDYMPVDDSPFYDTSLVRSIKPRDGNYYDNHPELGKNAEMLSDTYEEPKRESNKEIKAKMSRKDKKLLDKQEKLEKKKAKIEAKKTAYQKQQQKSQDEIMSFVDGMGSEHIKYTKSGKPRKINPLKLRKDKGSGGR